MIKQVIVLRTDLNMRKGKMAAQAAHASMKVFFDRGWVEFGKFGCHVWPEAEEWIKGIFTKIVVGCKSEQELLDLHEKTKEAKLPSALIQDSGATEFHGQPTYTALAVGPANSEEIDKITGELKLL